MLDSTPSPRFVPAIGLPVLLTTALMSTAAFADLEPDLVVSDINFSSTPTPGVPTTATATLKNAGTASSGVFNVKWFLDGVQVGYGQHASLGAGQTSNDNVRLSWTPTPGDHVLRFDADVDGQVSELSEVNNSYQVKVSNGQKVPLADLFSYGVQYGTFRVGEPATAKASLLNQGQASSGAFDIKWFADGVQVAYGGHSNLPPGAISNDNVTLFWTPTSAGDHVLRFAADVGGQVLESNETNNTIDVTIVVQPALADLVVDAIDFSSPPTIGETTIATAHLRNVGGVASGPFSVKWFLDGAQVGYGGHVSLDPGQTSNDNVRFSWTPTAPGSHTLRFLADADNQVTETSESNNSSQTTVTVRAADLLVDAITFSSPPSVGEQTIATARLRNVGQAASGPFNIKWFLDGNQVGYGGHASLAPGQTSSDNVYFTWTPTTGANHTLRYEADVDGDVPENDEGNNAFQVTVAVRAADLLVDAISFSSPPTVDVPTVATAHLRNVGQLASGPFNVKWFLDGAQVGYGQHVSLDPGQTSNDNVHFSWTPAAGTHRLRFEADVDNQVVEASETNNAWEVTVVVLQADLLVDDISFSSPPMAGETTVASARLRNVGSAASGDFNVKWFVDGAQVGYGRHLSLAPGEISTGNVHLTWIPPSAGLHRVRFEADVDGEVNESNEANNAFEVTAKVGPLPDLLVDDITFSTLPIAGLPTVATARLRNVGPAASGPFNVKWFLDGTQVGYGSHPGLASGETSTALETRFNWTPASAGPHTLRYEADVDGQVLEVDETNNAFQRTVDVARNPVELGFSSGTSLSLTADGWYSQDPVTLQVTANCPASGPPCGDAAFTVTGTGNGARFYLYGHDPGPTGNVLCDTTRTGSQFSHGSFSASCSTPMPGVFSLAPGESRTLRWFLWIQPSDQASLDVSAGWAGYSSRLSLAVPRAAIHPLVFIHGILGSMPPQDKLVTSESDALDVLDPFLGSYPTLLDNLQYMGYEWDKTLFGLAYDWRSSNVLSAVFLAKQLASAVIPRSNAASVPYTFKDGKADLVVHSMGGLVSRAYIEDKAFDPITQAPVPYAGNVNKVVFIASPHRGFPFDYRTREGLTWYDYLYNAPFQAGSFTMPIAMDGLIWPSLVEKKFKPTDAELDRDCTWVPYQSPPSGLVPYFLYFPRLKGSVIGYSVCTIEDITPWAQDPPAGRSRSTRCCRPTSREPPPTSSTRTATPLPAPATGRGATSTTSSWRT